ncbi:CsiV family protein [Legionella longbeachae]|uniref:Lipoprotein n=1 Tax=Legionella longbeachae serogroup 1 (strain NSW150) TaxID=661367 RepID=D3HRC6_LEGLN|nr:CsiV family protein [Legionella longbeachae]VEE01960.1 Protein of uncharacterised function (DUF2803) [Legionella oakridgensis]HBD7396788.1 hypothetical protein [Legionella pneumophila]ARB91728.1 hypothetical protein A6J40_05825 [Legionella longbeachae]ARM35126.1 hypothetical protein B0B39_17130 [Legionella longbeachae]EEZ95434.1 putative lipoprotein [Legionella longbeachae D-4968]
MERSIIIILSILYSCCSFAKSLYQIDLIIFTHPNQISGLTINTPLLPTSSDAISLHPDKEKSGKPYRLLPVSYSSLRDEYYLLTRKGHYQVLGHYSWRQPANNQSKVALPFAEHNGWQMQGTLDIRQSNYYSLDAELQVSPPSHPHESFLVTQKQRLKGNVIYYLDNAQVGMIVKIHQLS